MTTQHACAGSRIAYTKGAADQLLRRCERISLNGTVRPITEGDVEAVNAAVGEMSANALRVLALASRDGEGKPVEEKLTFLGLVGMIDPPRPEAAEAVRIFKQAKVRTVMITGDHRDTAFAIAKELGIARNLGECVTGEELDRMTVDELRARGRHLRVCARVARAQGDDRTRCAQGATSLP